MTYSIEYKFVTVNSVLMKGSDNPRERKWSNLPVRHPEVEGWGGVSDSVHGNHLVGTLWATPNTNDL